MAVHANATETFDSNLIREDLAEAFSLISPTETPFLQMVGKSTATNTLHEWPVVELEANGYANRAIEGDEAPTVNTPNTGKRMSNITQISTKTAKVTTSSTAVNAAAGNIQRMKGQISLRLKELKRDMEGMLLDNVAASAGSSGAARSASGLGAFLRTNTVFEAGGSDPTLSGTTEGYPNVASVAGTTPVVFSEDDLNALIEAVWNSGGTPSVILCNGTNKRRISSAFVGNSEAQRQVSEKTIVNAAEFYDSDFGYQAIVPSRLLRASDTAGSGTAFNVFVLDPEMIKVAYLDDVTQTELARVGLAETRQIHTEYTLEVSNEAAHGVCRDTKNTLT